MYAIRSYYAVQLLDVLDPRDVLGIAEPADVLDVADALAQHLQCGMRALRRARARRLDRGGEITMPIITSLSVHLQRLHFMR